MIEIPSLVQDAIEADGVRYCVLIKVEMGTPLYLTNHSQDITYSGNVYDSSAHVDSISNIKQAGLTKNPKVTISLSGVDQTYYSLFLTNNYINRTVVIYYAFLDSDDVMIETPVEIYSGIIAEVSMADSPNKGTAKVSLIVGGRFTDFDKTTGRLTNTESQKQYFPLDKGFEFTKESGDYSDEWVSPYNG